MPAYQWGGLPGGSGMITDLKAPFPYFGGKATVADVIWEALGQPKHYIEPFAGSCAILLNRKISDLTDELMKSEPND